MGEACSWDGDTVMHTEFSWGRHLEDRGDERVALRWILRLSECEVYRTGSETRLSVGFGVQYWPTGKLKAEISQKLL